MSPEQSSITASFAQRMRRVGPSAIMELLKTAGTGEYISFASGLPDPTLFPIEELSEAAENVLRTAGALQYGPAEGYPPLRDWVAERLRARGFTATAENILLTSGSQQALDIVARAFLNEGDRVCVESPTYLAALQVFDSWGASYSSVAQDDDGMDVVGAERALESGCKLLFALPNFQNPTGRTLSFGKRDRLASALDHASTVLLEDDAYYDLRYEGDALPPIGSLMRTGTALYSGTFSKTIAPGLRVGYLFGPTEVISHLAHLKQMTDLHTGSLAQRMVHWFVTSYYFDRQIQRLQSVYRSKRDVMLVALSETMPSCVQWTRPEGGMFLWMTLPEPMDATALLPEAMASGIMFVPGKGFHTGLHQEGTGVNTLRLNFVSAPKDKIPQGIRILAELIRSHADRL